MKKQIEICQHCKHSKHNNGLIWCSKDNFDIQTKITDIDIFAEETEPTKECKYQLGHTVLSQDSFTECI